jgi:hypothetical protein
MATSRLPAQYTQLLRLLQSLESAEYKSLHRAISKADQYSDWTDLARRILTQNVDRLSADELIGMLMSINIGILKNRSSVGEIVGDMVTSYRRYEKPTVQDIQAATLEKRLVELVTDAKVIRLQSKLIDVASAQERIFREGRIFTDIRAVFPDTETVEAPLGAVILHTLRLRFHEDGAMKTIFVCLDDSDLDDLQKQIARAREKSVELSKVISKADLRRLNE